jgi:hypothetical protein
VSCVVGAAVKAALDGVGVRGDMAYTLLRPCVGWCFDLDVRGCGFVGTAVCVELIDADELGLGAGPSAGAKRRSERVWRVARRAAAETNASHLRRYSERESGVSVKGGEMRTNTEQRRERVRTTSQWRNARTARVYRGRRVAAVFWRGCAGGDGGDGDLALAGCDKGIVGESLTGMKGADGTVGDMFRAIARGMGWLEDVAKVCEKIRNQAWSQCSEDGHTNWIPRRVLLLRRA